jgi:hypothetical protein
MKLSAIVTLAIAIGVPLIARAETPQRKSAIAQATLGAPAVVNLGKIGAAATSAEMAARVREPPSKDAALGALRLTVGANASLGTTYRITPRTPYNAHMSVQWACHGVPSMLSTSGNSNVWTCDSGSNNTLRFDFRDIKANTTYLVTLDFGFPGSMDVETTVNGNSQTTTITNPAHPLFLVFQTGAGQTAASITLKKVHGSAYGSGGSFHSAELTEVH